MAELNGKKLLAMYVKGEDGASGVTNVTSGEPIILEDKTITPITFDFEKGNSKTVNVSAHNGNGGGIFNDIVLWDSTKDNDGDGEIDGPINEKDIYKCIERTWTDSYGLTYTDIYAHNWEFANLSEDLELNIGDKILINIQDNITNSPGKYTMEYIVTHVSNGVDMSDGSGPSVQIDNVKIVDLNLCLVKEEIVNTRVVSSGSYGDFTMLCHTYKPTFGSFNNMTLFLGAEGYTQLFDTLGSMMSGGKEDIDFMKKWYPVNKLVGRQNMIYGSQSYSGSNSWWCYDDSSMPDTTAFMFEMKSYDTSFGLDASTNILLTAASSLVDEGLMFTTRDYMIGKNIFKDATGLKTFAPYNITRITLRRK